MQHGFVQVSGKVIPKPVKNWNQCGISSKVMDVLKKAGLADPMPIQVCPPLPSSDFWKVVCAPIDPLEICHR